jgi:hypothetical protein
MPLETGSGCLGFKRAAMTPPPAHGERERSVRSRPAAEECRFSRDPTSLASTGALSLSSHCERSGRRWRRSITQRSRLGYGSRCRADTAPVPPLLPGIPECRTHDYVRNGNTNSAALDLVSGQVIADMTPAPCAEEFRRFSEPDRRLGCRRISTCRA